MWITSKTFADFKPLKSELGQGQDREALRYRHVLFRKKFRLEHCDQPVLRITADDYYKLYINGVFVTGGPAPGYPSRYYYNEIDLKEYVRAGENLLAVHTLYQGLINRVWVSGDLRQGVDFTLYNGGKKLFESDKSVLCAEHTGMTPIGGMIGYDTQLCERYDCRAPECGFERPDYDDTGWGNAYLRKFIDYQTILQPTRQLQIYEADPARIEETQQGYRIDFGKEYVGYMVMRCFGKSGDKVLLRRGEELNPDGTVRYRLRANAVYEDEWILSEGESHYSEFDYKAFRYAEILLPPGVTLDVPSVKAVVRHYPFAEKASFISDDERLRKVWNICSDTLRYGTQEVFVDCPQREKGQYTGDSLYLAQAYTLLTGDAAMMKKLICDEAESAFRTPALTGNGPCAFRQDIADYSLLFPVLLSKYYQLTKDARFTIEMLPAAAGVLRYFSGYARPDGLIAGVKEWCVVDWPGHCRDGYAVDPPPDKPCKECHCLINAYYVGAIKTYQRLCEKTGAQDTLRIAPPSEAFNRIFKREDGLYRDAEGGEHAAFHSAAAALLFGLCAENKQAVIDFLMGKRLDCCNIFGAYNAVTALFEAGEKDFVFDLLTDEKYWLNFMRQGSNVTGEAFDYDNKGNTAVFHTAFAFAMIYLIRGWGVAATVTECGNP